MALRHINQEQFRQMVMNYDNASGAHEFQGSRPAAVDFYAPWCSPCRALSLIWEELAEEYEGKVDFYKVNIDEDRELANDFHVRGIPTLVFFSPDSDPHNFIGYYSKSELRHALERLIRT